VVDVGVVDVQLQLPFCEGVVDVQLQLPVYEVGADAQLPSYEVVVDVQMLLWQGVLSKAVLVVPVQREGEEPVLEEPVLEEPVREEPVREEPVLEEGVLEEGVLEEGVLEEGVLEEGVLKEPVREAHGHHVLEVLSKAGLVPAPHEGEVRLGLVALDHQQGQGEACLLLHRLAWEVPAR
jgi:hypothetical protein